MLLLTIAIMMQAQPAPDVTPKRCVAVADRFEWEIKLVGAVLPLAPAPPGPPSESRVAIADGMAAGTKAIAAIRKRWPGVTPDAAMVAEVEHADSNVMTALVKACAAPA